MLFVALALAASMNAAPVVLDLIPTDDVWVYPHASDPEKDMYLRCWGGEGRDVAKDANELPDFSYSYLKWDVSKVPAGKIKEATITFTHIGNVGYDLAYAKDHTMRLRPVASDFSEKNWKYEWAEANEPDAGRENIFGEGAPLALPAHGKDFKITIDLLKGQASFKNYLEAAEHGKKALALALTSTINVEEMGQKCIYKVYSKDAEGDRKPVLHLVIEP